MKVALAQLRSSSDPFENLLCVDAFVQEATQKGAKLVCFPENVFYRGSRQNSARSESIFTVHSDLSILPTTEFSRCFLEFRKSWNITVSLGSVLEKNTTGNPFNAHWVLAPTHNAVVSYHKIHLFCFDSGSAQYNEALDFSPGSAAMAAKVEDWNLGLSICYDLRFPELFRHLTFHQNTEALLIPAAFTQTTGEQHWHTLLRARAIENQSYVLACGQWGSHLDAAQNELFCYGHTLAYDPWGTLVAEAPGDQDALLVVDLSKERVAEVRKKLPALQNALFHRQRASLDHSIFSSSEEE